ncbi:radical SAM protein [Bradyrhizobium sp. Arg816]|uniref:radical SAM protein n=1 Tax=Bradyrhizobium sp. Arg816 TaxID=2998491 RepID=UPI00249E8108|nr:radical SAM protein [Bradyrhizobium sp. Arg816]MDI3567585.1 radical SAM protein [Bradyrhizobium sp. Arg816]
MAISVSFYCNLHCEHCYVPEQYRARYRRRLEPSQLTMKEITNFVDLLVERYSLKKVIVTGGEPLLKIVFPRSAALMSHAANKRGIHVQLNTGGLGQIPIRDVASIFDDREKLTFQFNFDAASAEALGRFRTKRGAHKSALRQMAEAINCGALVQARMIANRHNIREALDAYRILSSIGVGSFRIMPIFGAGIVIDDENARLGAAEEIKEILAALTAMAAQTSTRLELPNPILVDTAEPRPNVRFTECNCCLASGYLSTNGDLYPCSYAIGDPDSHKFVVGNVRYPGFDLETAWRRTLKKYQSSSGCAHCPMQIALLRKIESRAFACA